MSSTVTRASLPADRPPRLLDPAALARQRARATGIHPLRRAIRAEVEDRLATVNRTFTRPVVVTALPDLWSDHPSVLPSDDLGLAAGAHDLVIHDFALHWSDDPVGQLAQGARALEPDGLLIATLAGGRSLAALRQALVQAELDATGGASPRVLPMADLRDWGGLIGRAGLALPVADADPFRLTYADALALMRDLRAMGEGNALAGRLRSLSRRDVLLGAAARYPTDPDGRVTLEIELVTLTGWAPSADQPRPLRPGTATRSLAEALAYPKEQT